MLYNLIISPIEMIVNWVFTFFTIKFSNFGIIGAIFGVSLVINFLALPLYNIADSLQEKERKISKSLEYRVNRIKKAFKGDERFMMIQTYYRQNNYNPLYVLRSSLSILIEIPFFIAAYHYLSHLEALKGSSFWIFKDLASPDGLFQIGNFSIHILPIIMTLINFISGAIYTKDATFKEKIQLFVMALIFLILLYNSPSGLVIYWILNNLFSLVKNIVMKTKNPGKILHIIICALLFLMSFFFFFKSGALYKKVILLGFSIFIAFLPFLKSRIKLVFKFLKYTETVSKSVNKSGLAILIFSGLALSFLCGLYLPSSVISTSPVEFSFLGNTPSPVSYIYSTFSSFLGFFLFWPLCIYFMFGKKVKVFEPVLFFVLFVTALLNVFVFSADYGNFDVNFALEEPDVLKASVIFKIIPFFAAVLLFAVYYICVKFKKEFILTFLLIAICISEFAIGIVKTNKIKSQFLEFSKKIKEPANKTDSEKEISPIYHFSKDKNNVVVIFLDRAVNSFLPYAMKEIPELNEQLKGFMYYPNTLSYSTSTIIASPCLMGGYEYTPENLNKRSGELLQKKHNEASLLMPKLFKSAGFDVAVSDPPAPNYSVKSDFSPFESENIKTYELFGKYVQQFKDDINFYSKVSQDSVVFEEIKNFAVIQILFPAFRNTFYGDFKKNSYSQNYINMISSLYFLPELTDFTSDNGSFIFIDNETTHEPANLKDDFLTPSNASNFNHSYKTSDELTSKEYQVFAAAFKQLGKWFDFLRENNAYDNTRIIIVSDHGCNKLPLNDFSSFKNNLVPSAFTPVLLVKDFNSNEDFSINNKFMTNADTLFLAKKNLPISDINPFTGKKLVQEKENGINVFQCYEVNEQLKEWQVQYMIDKTQFTLDKKSGWHVSDSIFDEKNWIPILEYNSEYENHRGEK